MSRADSPDDPASEGPRATAQARNAEDLALLAAWRGGDARAGDVLARHYSPQLARFFADKVRDFEVDDLVQQTWEALIHARDRFVVPGEPGAPQAGAPIAASFRAYLYGTARFVLFAHFRRRARAAQFDPNLSSIEDLSPSPSRQASVHARLERLAAALRKLPLDMQILLELRYGQEMTSAEIAAVYEIPRNTAKSRLRAAKERLDAQLARMGLGPAPG